MAIANANRPVVLLVEDDDDVRSALGDQLRDAGFNVEAVANGIAAWSRLTKGSRPGLLVLDLKVPGVSGWELLDRLRESPSLISVPVIVVSAYLGFPPSGALAWMKKPVNPQAFLAEVRRLYAA